MSNPESNKHQAAPAPDAEAREPHEKVAEKASEAREKAAELRERGESNFYVSNRLPTSNTERSE